MIALGWFQDQSVELIDGELLDLPAPSNQHCISTEWVAEQLRAAFGIGHWIRVQMSLDLSPNSEPVPDVAVAVGTPRQSPAHPKTALLVVEISDSSLSYDRNRKANLYSAAGIPDYWIVNLADEQLEIRRDPQIDSSAPFGFRYLTTQTLARGDNIAPPALPNIAIAVTELLS